MAPETPPPLPGSMTVPPLFGWEVILAVLLIVAVVAVVFLLIGSTRADGAQRAEWQAWLDARSSSRPASDPDELLAADPGRQGS